METDKSNSNGKLFTSKSSTNGGIQADDFLIEFFPELKVTEVQSLTKDKEEMQQNLVNGHGSVTTTMVVEGGELSQQNERLRQANKELKEKSLLQESQIARYEAELSEKLQHVLTVNQELEKVKNEYDDLSSVKEGIEKEMTQLKVQIGQLLETRDKNSQASNQILELQKDISSKEKVQRKLRNEVEVAAQKLAERNGLVRRVKSANKKLWNIIMEMGETLSKHGLLTVKKKEQCLKEIDDQFVSDSEGDSIKAILCGLSTSSPATSAPPANLSDSRSEERHRISAESCVTSNVKSYSSNYFMKTHKDVIEDLVSEDYNELNHFRQQLSVRNDPISPLPPTPPPKNAKFKADQPSKSSVFAGKKLNFFHQQSESFDVETVEPSPEKSPPRTSEYTISSKLNHDGSLKLDFSANYDTHLSFDLNTRKVSCTVMPGTRIQMDRSKDLVSSTPAGGSPRIKPVCSEDRSAHASGASDERHPKRVRPDTKRVQKPAQKLPSDSPGGPPISSHEKKTLNDIRRSGKVYSAFVPPSSEKRVTVIPSVRVSPRQLKPSTSECRPMEIDEPVAVSEKGSASPKKRKKRSRKVKNSEELFQSLNEKGRRKTKKRKTLDFEKEKNEVGETNECIVSNNEDESKQQSGTHCVIASPEKSHFEGDTKLQRDSLSPPSQSTPDLFKVPCSVSLDKELPGRKDNDMDFSDIQVSPFNPSTFVPRGLFDNALVSLGEGQKSNPDDKSVSEQVASNGERCESPSEESAPSNPVGGTVDNNASSVVSTLNNDPLVSSTLGDCPDSDHSLVIAEDVEQSAPAVDSPCKSEGRRVARRKAKRPQVKKCPRRKEEAVTIEAAFKSLEEMKFTDAHFKQNQHTLVNALINPKNAAGMKEVAHLILEYLVSTRANPLIGYFMSEDEAVLMPLKERCIVHALFQVSKKRKSRLHGLLPSIVDTAYELVLAKESLQIYGLSSLCRLVTEVCRCLEDKRRPLMLCSELLKLQHKFAPYLIASVAGVWKELFSVDQASDEERIFHSSIVYGTQRKPPALNEQQWKHCGKVLSAFLSAQFPYQISEMVPFLVRRIEERAIAGCLDSDEFVLSTPLVVFTAVEGWGWSKQVLILPHIIPLLAKFSGIREAGSEQEEQVIRQEVNEKAFTAFCQLYADVCYFCPNEEEPQKVLEAFFKNELDEEGLFKSCKKEVAEFVKHRAAMAQLKLCLHKKQVLPPYLEEWIPQIQDRADYVQYAERLFHRRLMNTEAQFLETEVL